MSPQYYLCLLFFENKEWAGGPFDSSLRSFGGRTTCQGQGSYPAAGQPNRLKYTHFSPPKNVTNLKK
jgi:hypothetical protein